MPPFEPFAYWKHIVEKFDDENLIGPVKVLACFAIAIPNDAGEYRVGPVVFLLEVLAHPGLRRGFQKMGADVIGDQEAGDVKVGVAIGIRNDIGLGRGEVQGVTSEAIACDV